MASRKILRIFMAIFFVVAGAMHFMKPHVYEEIMPPWLPWHAALINISGALEIAGGLALSAPFPVARTAALCLIGLLILVFPVNVCMAVSAAKFQQIPPTLLWMRLPLQFVLVYLLLWCTEARGGSPMHKGKVVPPSTAPRPALKVEPEGTAAE